MDSRTIYKKIHSGDWMDLDISDVFSYKNEWKDYGRYNPPREFDEKFIFSEFAHNEDNFLQALEAAEWLTKSTIRHGKDFSHLIDKYAKQLRAVSRLGNIVRMYPRVFGLSIFTNPILREILMKHMESSELFRSYIPGMRTADVETQRAIASVYKKFKKVLVDVKLDLCDEFVSEFTAKEIFTGKFELYGEEVKIETSVIIKAIPHMDEDEVIKHLDLVPASITMWSSIASTGIKFPMHIVDMLMDTFSIAQVSRVELAKSFPLESVERYVKLLNPGHILSSNVLTDSEIASTFKKFNLKGNEEDVHTRYYSEDFVLSNKDLFHPLALADNEMPFKLSKPAWKKLCEHWDIKKMYPSKRMYADNIFSAIGVVDSETFTKIAKQEPVTKPDIVEQLISRIAQDWQTSWSVTDDFRKECKVLYELLNINK